MINKYNNFSLYVSSPIFREFDDIEIDEQIRSIIDEVVQLRMRTPAWKLG